MRMRTAYGAKWVPAFEAVRKSEILVIPGLGRSLRARNPRTQAPANLGRAGVHRFRAWSCGPSRNDKAVNDYQGHFLTTSKEGRWGWLYSCCKNRRWARERPPSQFRCHSPAGCQKFRCRVGLHSARKIMKNCRFLAQRGRISGAGTNFSLLSGTSERRT